MDYSKEKLVLDSSVSNDGMDPNLTFYRLTSEDLDNPDGWVEFLLASGKVETLPIQYLNQKAPGWRDTLTSTGQDTLE